MILACRAFTSFFILDDMLDSDVGKFPGLHSSQALMHSQMYAHSSAKYDIIPGMVEVIAGTKVCSRISTSVSCYHTSD